MDANAQFYTIKLILTLWILIWNPSLLVFNHQQGDLNFQRNWRHHEDLTTKVKRHTLTIFWSILSVPCDLYFMAKPFLVKIKKRLAFFRTYFLKSGSSSLEICLWSCGQDSWFIATPPPLPITHYWVLFTLPYNHPHSNLTLPVQQKYWSYPAVVRYVSVWLLNV